MAELLRKCLATGKSVPTKGMVRFVATPDHRLVPDCAGNLPGRGLWVTATESDFRQAVNRKAFHKGVGRNLEIADDLPAQIEAGLARRALATLGLAKRANLVVHGFQQVSDALREGRLAALVQASDAAASQGAKLRRLAKTIALVDIFAIAELSAALGRDNSVNVGLRAGGLTEKFKQEADRLSGFRPVDRSPLH